MRIWTIRLLGLAFGLSLGLAACASVGQKGMKPVQDWSRGLPLADTARGSIALAVAPDGEAVHLVWPNLADTGVRMRYLQLDDRGSPSHDRQLEAPYLSNRSPRLAPAGGEGLHLVWATRPARDSGWELWYSLLDGQGQQVEPPRQISPPGVAVGDYDIAPDEAGDLYLVWADARRGGVSGLHIDAAGQAGQSSALLVPEGTAPSLRRDDRGGLHLAWVEGQEIHYGYSPPGDPWGLVDRAGLTGIRMGTGDSLYGPVLGLSDGWVYVIWSQLRRSGLEAGTAGTSFVAFPQGDPGAVSRPQPLAILPTEDQPYEPYQGTYNLSQLVRPQAIPFNSDFVYEPFTLEEQEGQLAVALSTKQNLRQDSQVQIAVAVFGEGVVQGYEYAAKTAGISGEPHLAVGGRGELHLVWREGAAGDRVFYATTAPESRAAIDRLGLDDLVTTALEGGVEGLATALLFPLATPWLVPGFVLLGVWKIYRDYESLAHRSSWAMLIVALAFYHTTKLLFLPTILEYVPFSAWIDIPPLWEIPLRIGVPLAILALSILAAEVGRRRSQSTFLYYTLAAIVDMVLTLAVYGVNYLGVF